MATWRLDIDEAAIYCGDERVAALVSDCSNEGWRKACRVGQDIVDAMNGADRSEFECRMRALGRNQTELSRLDSGEYLSPAVQSAWHATNGAVRNLSAR